MPLCGYANPNGESIAWGMFCVRTPKCALYRAAAAENGSPSTGGSMGLDAIFNFSISASWRRLAFALLFWNQILTWVSVRFRDAENSALSAMDKYCFCRNFLSKESNCEVVKGVLGFRLVLCFLSEHFWAPIRLVGLSSAPGMIIKDKYINMCYDLKSTYNDVCYTMRINS
jgi:hypothetical protein